MSSWKILRKNARLSEGTQGGFTVITPGTDIRKKKHLKDSMTDLCDDFQRKKTAGGSPRKSFQEEL